MCLQMIKITSLKNKATNSYKNYISIIVRKADVVASGKYVGNSDIKLRNIIQFMFKSRVFLIRRKQLTNK